MCMHVCVFCHKDGRAFVGICDSRAIGERAELLAERVCAGALACVSVCVCVSYVCLRHVSVCMHA